MLLLIDAYNLLHQSDVLGRSRGERWLERARRRLIRKLIEHLDAPLAAETCLVFDANSPPPDLPSRYVIGSMQLIYAVEYPEADDLLELLIARHPAPRRLTVVSSDHRIQRAASRRGATSFDADIWYARLTDRGPQLGIAWPPGATEPPERGHEKPPEPANSAELAEWFEHFAIQIPEPPEGEPEPQPKGESPGQASAKPKKREKAAKSPTRLPQPKRKRTAAPPRDPHRPLDPDRSNPFPDGYGEDLI